MSETRDDAALPEEVTQAFATAALVALQELTQCEAIVNDPPSSVASPVGPLLRARLRLVRSKPGSLTVVMTDELARDLAGRFLPPGAPILAELVADFAGELANVVAGQAKTMLKGTPYHFTMSTPVVERVSDSATVTGDSRPPAASLSLEAGDLLLFVELVPCDDA